MKRIYFAHSPYDYCYEPTTGIGYWDESTGEIVYKYPVIDYSNTYSSGYMARDEVTGEIYVHGSGWDRYTNPRLGGTDGRNAEYYDYDSYTSVTSMPVVWKVDQDLNNPQTLVTDVVAHNDWGSETGFWPFEMREHWYTYEGTTMPFFDQERGLLLSGTRWLAWSAADESMGTVVHRYNLDGSLVSRGLLVAGYKTWPGQPTGWTSSADILPYTSAYDRTRGVMYMHDHFGLTRFNVDAGGDGVGSGVYAPGVFPWLSINGGNTEAQANSAVANAPAGRTVTKLGPAPTYYTAPYNYGYYNGGGPPWRDRRPAGMAVDETTGHLWVFMNRQWANQLGHFDAQYRNSGANYSLLKIDPNELVYVDSRYNPYPRPASGVFDGTDDPWSVYRKYWDGPPQAQADVEEIPLIVNGVHVALPEGHPHRQAPEGWPAGGTVHFSSGSLSLNAAGTHAYYSIELHGILEDPTGNEAPIDTRGNVVYELDLSTGVATDLFSEMRIANETSGGEPFQYTYHNQMTQLVVAEYPDPVLDAVKVMDGRRFS